MNRFWSPLVGKLAPYVPGEQPRDRAFIKLNTNENPYGPSPLAIEAIRAAADDGLRLYPDPLAAGLRDAIASTLSLGADHVFVGNGSDEVLAHCFNAFLGGKEQVLFADVTYSFYRTYCGLYSLSYREIALDDAFRYDPRDYCGPCGGVVIANPNAPTGIAMTLDDVQRIIRQNPDVVVIVDEAYVDFGGESAVELIGQHENLVVVQTFSKSRSLAGLRVGFAAAQPHLIEALRRVKDSFNSYPLGRLALAGAAAAWTDRAWFDRTRRLVIAEREKMTATLVAQGFNVLPSAANFVFASHDRVPAERIFDELRQQGILVRHFSQERIRNWLRISVGKPEECGSLLEAAGKIVRGASS